MTEDSLPHRLVEELQTAEHIVVLTGAGVSAESGVPTFREAQTGLWAKYDAQELATPAAFRRNPKLVWDWYQWRRGLIWSASPNEGHYALAQLEQLCPRFSLITQNVDGLHQEAGSVNVIELHGNLWRNRCFANGHPVDPGGEILAPDTDGPPRCPRCQSLLRPDVVWFGETLPRSSLDAAYAAAQTCQLFLVIGTSAVVHPASSIPYVAAESGALIVEINPERTPLTPHADFALHRPAGQIVPRLVAHAWPNAHTTRTN